MSSSAKHCTGSVFFCRNVEAQTQLGWWRVPHHKKGLLSIPFWVAVEDAWRVPPVGRRAGRLRGAAHRDRVTVSARIGGWDFFFRVCFEIGHFVLFRDRLAGFEGADCSETIQLW
jgi:hypothetical protein